MNEELWDIVVKVHLKGTYCVTPAGFNHMKERGQGGVIINTSSTSGLNGNFGQSNYGAAKAGIWGFTRCLAIEGQQARHPRVHRSRRSRSRGSPRICRLLGREDEGAARAGLVSPLIVFLASDLAKDLTDKTFFVGGGRIAEMRMVTAKGVTKTDDGGLWTAEEIAARDEADDPDAGVGGGARSDLRTSRARGVRSRMPYTPPRMTGEAPAADARDRGPATTATAARRSAARR